MENTNKINNGLDQAANLIGERMAENAKLAEELNLGNKPAENAENAEIWQRHKLSCYKNDGVRAILVNGKPQKIGKGRPSFARAGERRADGQIEGQATAQAQPAEKPAPLVGEVIDPPPKTEQGQADQPEQEAKKIPADKMGAVVIDMADNFAKKVLGDDAAMSTDEKEQGKQATAAALEGAQCSPWIIVLIVFAAWGGRLLFMHYTKKQKNKENAKTNPPTDNRANTVRENDRSPANSEQSPTIRW